MTTMMNPKAVDVRFILDSAARAFDQADAVGGWYPISGSITDKYEIRCLSCLPKDHRYDDEIVRGGLVEFATWPVCNQCGKNLGVTR